MPESIKDTLQRARRQRAHINYCIENVNGLIDKELPFVCGVIADISGDSAKNLEDRKFEEEDRNFVEIDSDNFNDALKAKLKTNQLNSVKMKNVSVKFDKNKQSEVDVEVELNKLSEKISKQNIKFESMNPNSKNKSSQ